MTERELGPSTADANIAHLLRASAYRHGDRDAVRESGRGVGYQALWTRARAIGAGVIAAGVVPGEPVAIFVERGAEAAAAFFGVVAAGAVAVLVNETLRTRQIDQILAHSGARCLITTRERLGALPRPLAAAPHIIDLTTLDESGVLEGPIPRSARDLAQIVYTSGSSGAPKGVMVGHGHLRSATDTVVGYLGISAQDRVASLLPFSFVYGMSQLLCAIRTGATLVVERSPLPIEIVRTLAIERVTILAAVPPIWLRLLRDGLGSTPLPDLRVLTNAGGHLPVESVRALRRLHPGCELFLMYGLTEVLRSTYLPPSEVDARPDSIGRALPGSEVFLVDEQGVEVPTGEIGELVHRGPTVTAGYWKEPALTATVYRPDPRPGSDGATVVFSGDLARRDADGFLYHVSRKDRVIKTMGYRVGPDEILDVLYASGEVAEGAVVAEPDPLWGSRVVGYVVLAPGGDVGRLKRFCALELPRHLQPVRLEVREELPLLPSGKHDLLALEEEAVILLH
jgi:acyl-CoA synthetase (AMP-forming)/AMP-acid ligase II